MADVSNAELHSLFQKLITSIDRNTGLTGKLHNRGPGKRDKDDRDKEDKKGLDFRRDFTRGLGSMGSSLKKVGGSFNGLGGSAHGLREMFDHVLEANAVGKVLSDMLQGSEKLAVTYRKMIDVGQGFNGSMLEMASSAAAARMPLDEFAQMMKEFSTTASVLNVNAGKTGVTLGSLQLGVRDNLRQYGMLGMSLESVADLTGNYAETMRLQGHVSEVNNTTTVKSVTTLAKNITDFASITGVSREKIRDITMAALQDEALTSKMRNENNSAQKQALETGVAFLASMPGEVGGMLSKMMAQSVGYGSTYLSDDSKMFMEAGAQDFLGVVDDMKTKVEKGQFGGAEQGQFLDSMQTLYSQQSGMLHIQAAAGNESARKFIRYMDQLNGLSKEQFEAQTRLSESTKSFTNFILLIDDTLERFSGSFRQGFFDAVKGLEDRFKQLSDSGLLDKLSKGFGAVGTALGQLVMLIFSPENMTRLSNGLSEFSVWMDSFPAKVRSFYDEWAPVVSGLVDTTVDIGKALFYFGGMFASVLTKVHSALSFFGPTVAGVGTALVAYFGPKAIKAMFGSVASRMFGRTAEINTNIANVNARGVGIGSQGGTLHGLTNFETDAQKAAKGGMFSRARGWTEGAAEGGLLKRLAGRSVGSLLTGLEGLTGIMGKVVPGLAAGAVGAGATGVAGAATGGIGGRLFKGALGFAGKGVAGAVAGYVAKAALDALPKVTGKDTVASMLQYGMTGATIGSLIPGVGTMVGGAVGAAVGGIAENWSSITGMFGGNGAALATPGTPGVANPTDPTSALQTDDARAIRERQNALETQRTQETTTPMADRSQHDRRMIELTEEITRCMTTMTQLQSRANDHLRRGNDQARQREADG